MLRAAAAVHYTTDRERQAVEGSLGLRRGIVIPLGTEEGLLAGTMAGSLRRGNPAWARAPYVLVLSRLHPKKGLELLVEVFLDVVQGGEFPQWRLVVAGDGEPTYVRSLKRLVCERNGEAHVVFTGWLEGEARTAALQGAQLFALPSHQENFGLGVVEALGCEVPVLISDHVAVADEVRAAEAGWVAPRQRSALREAVEEALGDEGERARRGRAGRALVSRRFRWSTIAAELHALYSSLARGTEAGSRES